MASMTAEAALNLGDSLKAMRIFTYAYTVLESLERTKTLVFNLPSKDKATFDASSCKPR